MNDDFTSWEKTLDALDKLLAEIERVDQEELKASEYKQLRFNLSHFEGKLYNKAEELV